MVNAPHPTSNLYLRIVENPNLTEGPIRPMLWKLAIPMMLSIFFYTLYNIVDAYWVSKISDESIAAVSISQISLFILISLGFGVTVGSGVLMSMSIGAKNMDEAQRILGQSFVLSVIMAVIFTSISLVFCNQMLTLSGAGGDIFEPAKEYYLIVAGGSILMFIMMSVMFAFNAQGDTKTLTWLFAMSTLVNGVLDPIMIFGYFGFPAMGISGAAIATLISQFVFIVVALIILSSKKRTIRFAFKNLTFVWSSVKKVMNIGFPAALTQIVFPIGLAAMTYLTWTSFGDAGSIAFSLGFRIEFFAYLPAVGFGFASMAMIGQSVGAGNMLRATEVFNSALRLAFLGAMLTGILAAVFAGFLIDMFNVEGAATDYAKSYLWTVTFSYGFLAALLVQSNAFQAMNKSWPGFWIFVLRIGGVSIPLAILLCQVLDWNIYGIWTAVIAGNVISSVVGFIWIRRIFVNVTTPASTGSQTGV